MDILNKLREELQVERWQVEAAVKLIDEGNFQIPKGSDRFFKRRGTEKSVRASELSAQSGGEKDLRYGEHRRAGQADGRSEK